MGEGWTVRVWENMGWYYSVEKGVAEVHANIRLGAIKRGEARITYTCFLRIDGVPTITATTILPLDCFCQALVTARGYVQIITKALEDLDP